MMPTGLEQANLQEDKPLTTIPNEMRPAFDYTGLDAQTVDDLHFAEKTYQYGKKLAERGLIHMGDAIAVAHDALCRVVANCDNSKHGNRGEDTFRAWCVSIGITKDTAYRLLQVSALMDNSSPRQQKVLKELSPSLLYAVAKPSAPAELVAQVKSGDITTNKQYQEALAQLKAERDRADTAEAQRDAALADVNGLKERADAAEAREEEAWKMREKAEARAKDAENQLAGSRQVAEAARLRGDKLKAENDALKQQPITAVVDEEEVNRRAGEKAYQLAADMTAELQAKLDAVTGDAEQDARNAYDSVLLASRSMLIIWQMVEPQFRKLPKVQQDTLANQIISITGQINTEVAKCL